MALLDDIKEKAQKLIGDIEPFARRQTGVYDASKNKVIVAGLTLDGVTDASVSADVITKQEVGIDAMYVTYYRSVEARTLTVNILPTAYCLDVLRQLALKQEETNGWFNIVVHDNDSLVNVYRGFILQLPEISSQKESPDRQVIFGIVPISSKTSVVRNITDTERGVYSQYGTRSDESQAIPRDDSVINEDTGLVTYPYDIPTSDDVEINTQE